MLYGYAGFEKKEIRFGDFVKAWPDNDQPVGIAKMELLGVIVGIDDDNNTVDVKVDRVVFHTPNGTLTEKGNGEVVTCSSPFPIVTVGQ